MTVKAKARRVPAMVRVKQLVLDLGVQLANYALILVLALAIGALVILLSGKDPLAAYKALFSGALGSFVAVANTLDRSTILIMAGLSAVLAFSTSVKNLGIEGQLIMGAFAGAWVGFGIQGLPPFLHIPLAIAAGAVGGGLWSLPPILLKIRWNVEELVTTLMFNYIATLFTAYLVAFPFKSPGTILPGTDRIADSAKLPRLVRGSVLNVGFLIALALVFVVYWFLFRTKQGYELRLVGMNRLFSTYAGLPVQRSALLGMVLSGAMAGVGGAAIILGFFGRFITEFSRGYGWDGIVIALLAKNNPIAVVPAALFYAALANGSLEMQSATQVPTVLVTTVKGVIMFIVTMQALLTLINKGVLRWKQH